MAIKKRHRISFLLPPCDAPASRAALIRGLGGLTHCTNGSEWQTHPPQTVLCVEVNIWFDSAEVVFELGHWPGARQRDYDLFGEYVSPMDRLEVAAACQFMR